ncbi:MAG: hypothetical protein SAJ37_02360 [Oscillatoria sp. PMC 1068.18]|nr:hypothetical protein [Oscillatoria sp. PMC 1076.18]MEC4987566.1 hypothetical protein [Oscillatoria sp. PMC 1068.18]
MKAEPNFAAMSREKLMEYLEKSFDERALLELEKRPVPASVIAEHQEFLKWRSQLKQSDNLKSHER